MATKLHAFYISALKGDKSSLESSKNLALWE
jgi:hypothetical protein